MYVLAFCVCVFVRETWVRWGSRDPRAWRVNRETKEIRLIKRNTVQSSLSWFILLLNGASSIKLKKIKAFYCPGQPRVWDSWTTRPKGREWREGESQTLKLCHCCGKHDDSHWFLQSCLFCRVIFGQGNVGLSGKPGPKVRSCDRGHVDLLLLPLFHLWRRRRRRRRQWQGDCLFACLSRDRTAPKGKKGISGSWEILENQD